MMVIYPILNIKKVFGEVKNLPDYNDIPFLIKKMIPNKLECESYLIQLYINNTSTIPDQTDFSELDENDLRLF